MGAPRNLKPEEITEERSKDLYFRLKISTFKDYQGEYETYKFLKLIPINPTDTLYLDESLIVEGLFFRLLRISGNSRNPGWVIRGRNQATNLEQLSDILRRPVKEFLEPLKRLIVTNRIALKEAAPDEETEALYSDDQEESIPEENKTETSKNIPSPSDLVQLWNMHATALPKCLKLSKKRSAKARTRLKENPDLRWWENLFVRMNASPFLTGKTEQSDWKATFDWIVNNDNNALKVLEGKYDRFRQKTEEGGSELKSWTPDN